LDEQLQLDGRGDSRDMSVCQLCKAGLANVRCFGILSVFETDISLYALTMPITKPLQFVNSPQDVGPYQYPMEDTVPNAGVYALVPTATANELFLQQESRLCEIVQSLMRLRDGVETMSVVVKAFQALHALHLQKCAEWYRQCGQNDPFTVFTENLFVPPRPIHPALIAICLIVLVVSIIYGLPLDGAQLLG
jgi:hypothetical protein